MNTVVSAVFDTHAQAEKAVDILRVRGIPDAAISILSAHPDHVGAVTVAHDPEKDPESRGLLHGAVVGAGVGTLFGLAALALPTVIPFLVAGALANVAGIAGGSIVAGAAVGGALGTINGALKEQGIEDADAHYYETQIHAGGVFVSVDTGVDPHRAAVVSQVLLDEGGRTAPRIA